MSKIRLDQYLCQNGLVQSRERAKALIMSGIVFVNEQKADKAGEMISPDAKVEVRGHDIGYVSRGGLKLEKAMQVFPMKPDGKVCMDIGASTGGFTDCMLQNGAVKVYAVDVGYGQLAWSLRTDPRVVNMERTNIRNVKPEDLTEPVAFFSVDVSFIGSCQVSPCCLRSRLIVRQIRYLPSAVTAHCCAADIPVSVMESLCWELIWGEPAFWPPVKLKNFRTNCRFWHRETTPWKNAVCSVLLPLTARGRCGPSMILWCLARLVCTPWTIGSTAMVLLSAATGATG